MTGRPHAASALYVGQVAHLRLRPDKVASSCLPFSLGPYVSISPTPVAAEGAAVTVQDSVVIARRR